MNKMEERLWNYIDGTCSEEEQKAIDILIAQDEVYRRKYQELLGLNQEFAKMELDEPSMAFTYNVMEGIRAEIAQKPLKAGIDKRIIKGIAGFFILTIVLLVVYVLSTLRLGAGSFDVTFSGHLPDSLKMPDLKNIFSAPVIKGFLYFDLVLGLFLFDAYLRKRKVSKQL
jgi:hypothetical protein